MQQKQLIQERFPLEEVLADNPQYLQAMQQEQWAKGGGDIRWYALKATNALLQRQLTLLRSLEEKVNCLNERMSEMERRAKR